MRIGRETGRSAAETARKEGVLCEHLIEHEIPAVRHECLLSQDRLLHLS